MADSSVDHQLGAGQHNNHKGEGKTQVGIWLVTASPASSPHWEERGGGMGTEHCLMGWLVSSSANCSLLKLMLVQGT